MGNAKSQVAFLVEPMDPMPIVLRDFCYDSPSSIQIPPFMSRTKHDGVVHTVDGKVAFLWQGSSMTLMNTERSILMRMERKVCENINTHTIVVDRGRHARIRGVTPDPRLFGEYILDVIPGADVAFLVLLCASIDRIANLTRGVIL
ncbi:hypothetical protein DYB37_013960 [Aphanomyces astaci]|uniref:Uncharacterized protein n=1 Tax=Aphanomyces astaci TaxID=112090 RepID=A0A3R7EVR0_APHAT|nr:hypothetical protein DYB37_013960 [Aphanomyces astaci]